MYIVHAVKQAQASDVKPVLHEPYEYTDKPYESDSKPYEDSSLPGGAIAPPAPPATSVENPSTSEPNSNGRQESNHAPNGKTALASKAPEAPPPSSAPPPSPPADVSQETPDMSGRMEPIWDYALANRGDKALLRDLLDRERAGKGRVTLTGSLEVLIGAATEEEVTLRSPAQRAQDEMIGALAKLAYGVTEPEQFEALSTEAQANLRRYAREFREQSRTPEQVEIFAQWWAQKWNWKHKRGEMIGAPSLRQIKNQWFGAMKWAGGRSSQSNGKPRMPGDDPSHYRQNGKTRRRVLMPGDA